MTDAERLAELLEETRPTRFSTLYGVEGGEPFNRDGPEAAALIRAQSARIAALEDELREIADMTQKKQLPLTSMVNDKATEALGKGSE